MKGFKLGDSFKLTMKPDGKLAIEPDEAKTLAKLDVSARIKRRKSKRIKVKGGRK